MESLSNTKRVRSDSDDSTFNSPEAKKLRRELLVLDTVEDTNLYTVSEDLDSFIKSFEHEISHQSETIDSGEFRPDLEFLLEASDDELGLPPTDSAPSELETTMAVSMESVELGVVCTFDEQILNCESFEYGFDYADGGGNGNAGEYVALDGLFDYTDLGFGSSELSRRPESLPA